MTISARFRSRSRVNRRRELRKSEARGQMKTSFDAAARNEAGQLNLSWKRTPNREYAQSLTDQHEVSTHPFGLVNCSDQRIYDTSVFLGARCLENTPDHDYVLRTDMAKTTTESIFMTRVEPRGGAVLRIVRRRLLYREMKTNAHPVGFGLLSDLEH